MHITGKKIDVDKDGNVISERPCKKDLPRAHIMLQDAIIDIKDYNEATEHSIAISTLMELQSYVGSIKEVIKNLPEGSEKCQFNTECQKLDDYISSLQEKSKKSANQPSLTGLR